MKFFGITALIFWILTTISAILVAMGVEGAGPAAIGFVIISLVATFITIEIASDKED